jgi:hypothetical protein
LAPPGFRHWYAVVENCEVHRASIAGRDGADESAGTVAAKRACLSNNTPGFCGRIEPLVQRPIVDSRHGQYVDEAMTCGSELLIESPEKLECGARTEPIRRIGAGSITQCDLAAHRFRHGASP